MGSFFAGGSKASGITGSDNEGSGVSGRLEENGTFQHLQALGMAVVEWEASHR